MILNKNFLFLSIICICFSQVSVQISQQSNFASGKLLNNPFPIEHNPDLTEDYIINENLFSINISKNNFYIYTQLEYSDPPVFGINRNTSGSIT